MNQPLIIRMKHMGSTAADLEIRYEINEASQVVELETSAFDSELFVGFFVNILEQRNGIKVIRDDRTEWNPERPPYRVFLTMQGRRYEVTAHRLMQVLGGGITIVLNPMLEQIEGGFEEEILAAVGKLVIDKLKGHDEVAYAIFDELCPLFQNMRFPYHKVLTHTVLQHVSESEDSMEARLLQRMHPENLEYLRTSPSLSSLFEKK